MRGRINSCSVNGNLYLVGLRLGEKKKTCIRKVHIDIAHRSRLWEV